MVSVTPQNAAANGNLEALKIMAEADRANLFKRDQNGWRPIHEAARSGHVHVLEYLLKEGARINERTNDGEGGNPLWWAEKNAEKNREAIKLLKKYGGVSLQPKILDDKEEKSDPKKKED
jgi:prolyl 4-hydroxylase